MNPYNATKIINQTNRQRLHRYYNNLMLLRIIFACTVCPLLVWLTFKIMSSKMIFTLKDHKSVLLFSFVFNFVFTLFMLAPWKYQNYPTISNIVSILLVCLFCCFLTRFTLHICYLLAYQIIKSKIIKIFSISSKKLMKVQLLKNNKIIKLLEKLPLKM